MPHRSAFLLVCLASALLGASGCAHYQLGTGPQKLEFDSIFVEPIENHAALPQIVAPLTREIRAAFNRDGRVSLAPNHRDTDTVLTIRLVDRERTFTSVQPNDTALARKFDLTLTVEITLTDQRSGQDLFTHRSIQVNRQIYVDDGQNPAEYQVVPQLAATLADRVIHSVLDVW